MLIFSLTRTGRAAAASLLLLTGLWTRPAAAQLTQIEQLPAAVQPRWIDLAGEEWARGRNGRQTNFDYFVGLDREPRNAGFFGQRLRREMTALGGLTPETEAALDRYRRQKKLFLTERIVFVSTVIVAGADIVRTDYSYFENSELVIGAVAALSLLSNVWISRNTNSHLQRAVKEYQGAMFPQGPSGRTIDWRPSFGGLAPQRGGGVGVVVGWEL